MSESLVILLHGVGSSGADMARLVPQLSTTLTQTIFNAPDGPGRFNAGFQWFSIVGVTGDNRPARVHAARPAFDDILSDIISRTGFSDRLDRVALVGFSQGAIMALDALVSGRWPIAGAVAFSGRLASPEPLNPAAGSRVLLVHGTEDQMMPVGEAEAAQTTLEAAGIPTTSFIEKGLGHTISAGGVAVASDFLSELLR